MATDNGRRGKLTMSSESDAEVAVGAGNCHFAGCLGTQPKVIWLFLPKFEFFFARFDECRANGRAPAEKRTNIGAAFVDCG
jgi:hypothetical protein